MKRVSFLFVAVAALAGVVGFAATASRLAAAQEAAPVFVTKIPAGYRDWKFVSVAHEAGELNDIRTILGNEPAIKAYRAGKLPFPEGTIIARIAWRQDRRKKQQSLWPEQLSFRRGTALVPAVLLAKTQRDTPRRADGDTLN